MTFSLKKICNLLKLVSSMIFYLMCHAFYFLEVSEEDPTAQGEKNWTQDRFYDILKENFVKNHLSCELVDILISEEVTKEIFMNISLEELGHLFKTLSFGKKKQILLIRDKLKEDEETEALFENDNPEETNQREELSSEKFIETFRKYGHAVNSYDKYKYESELNCDGMHLSSLLQPLHRFMYKDVDIDHTPEWIAENAIPFIAACLNERANGTIHFGVVPVDLKSERIRGSVVGIPVDRRRILRKFYNALSTDFYEDDYEIVCKCICKPQFIPVINPENSKQEGFVVEIDVTPSSILTDESVYYTRKKESNGKNKCLFYRFKKGTYEPTPGTDEDIKSYMMIKSKLKQSRKEQEERNVNLKPNENLRQKFLDIFSAGFDTIRDELYPVLLLSPIESQLEGDFGAENFEFLTDIDPVVVFDFDSCSREKGMYHFVENDQEQCLKVLTTDSFDKSSEEHVDMKDSYQNMLEDLRQNPTRPWIFCNGHGPSMKEPFSRFDWKQQRIEGFKEAVRFYSSEIPSGRAIVMFLLFSKNYDILLDAAEEIILKFKNEWMLLAESEKIANHWKRRLLDRQCVDKKTLEQRCIIGIPWKEVNVMIKGVIGATQQTMSLIPMANGTQCHLKEKIKSELFDLEILSSNECQNDSEIMNDKEKRNSKRKTEEENFFRGEIVTWWNLSFGDDHVLKRSFHTKLLEKVKVACSRSDNEDQSKISIVRIYHHPGAGGTTSAKQILWELRDQYRCAIVRRISDITCEQINKLRNFNEQDTPKPPIIFIDNGDEEKLITLCTQLENRAKISSRRSEDQSRVFCVLLLCIRRPNLASNVGERSVQIRHDLEQAELDWFQRKGETLRKQFLHGNGVDPQLLLSFNLLKENFNPKYRQEVIKQFVDNIENEKEQSLLRYLSLINSFDLEFQRLPISAFDLLMTDGKRVSQTTTLSSFGIFSPQQRRHGWEINLSQALLVLINRGARVHERGRDHLKGLCIINQMFAKDILRYVLQKMGSTTSKVMIEFLQSAMFRNYNKSLEFLQKVVKDILKKREILDYNKRENFAPVIMDILEHEDAGKAGQILEFGFDLLKDPMIAQQVSRLYYTYKNWEKAAEYAETATRMKPENSFLWDTYGQVFKTQLKEMYIECFKSNDTLELDKICIALNLTKKAIDKFHREQITSEKEYYSKNTDNGYFGQVETIVTFLDLLLFFPETKEIETLRRFLVEPKFVPRSLECMDMEAIQFIKSLNEKANSIMRCLSEKISQLKWGVYNDLLCSLPDQRKKLCNLKENLDRYFGEESNDVPVLETFEETIDYVRRRICKLGGNSLKSIIDLRSDEKGREKLLSIQCLIQEKGLMLKPYLQDVITYINVLVIKNLKANNHEKEFRDMLEWTRRAYGMANLQNESHIYLEAYLFFVLFHWPTENRYQYTNDMCPIQQIQTAIGKWKNAYNKKYPRQKDENNPYQRRETTYFYLGNGIRFAEIVYYEDLFIDEKGCRYFSKGDSIWQKPEIRAKLKRLEGTLKPNGAEVLVQLKSAEGTIDTVTIPTSLVINGRTLWNKKVFFFLGFTWSGPKAFDVSQENFSISAVCIPDSAKLNLHTVPRGGQPYRQVSTDVTTHVGFIKRLTELNDRLDKIEKLKQLKVTSSEVSPT